MSKKRGPWTIEETTEIYQNSFIKVVEDKVIRPDGKPGAYSTVTMKAGVAILPIDKFGTLYLTRQFRYALGQESIEVVCGAIEENEPPLTAAKRELEEELGIKADEWIELGAFDLDTSIVHCPVYIFLAKQLKFTSTHREGTETIETVKIPFDTALQMVMDGKITHSPSCVTILKTFVSELYKRTR